MKMVHMQSTTHAIPVFMGLLSAHHWPRGNYSWKSGDRWNYISTSRSTQQMKRIHYSPHAIYLSNYHPILPYHWPNSLVSGKQFSFIHKFLRSFFSDLQATFIRFFFCLVWNCLFDCLVWTWIGFWEERCESERVREEMLSTRRDEVQYISPEKEVNAGLWTLWAGATLFLGLRIWCKVTRRTGLWYDDWMLVISWVRTFYPCIFSETYIDQNIASPPNNQHNNLHRIRNRVLNRVLGRSNAHSNQHLLMRNPNRCRALQNSSRYNPT